MKPSMFDLSGRTALVTGSSRGLGFTLAKGLAQAGATVVLHGRTMEGVQSAANELNELDCTVHATAFDVADGNTVAAAAATLKEQGVVPDIIINNAGNNLRAPLLSIPHEDWRKVLETHLDGPFHVARAFVPEMINRGSGRVINICSLTSTLTRPTISAYATAKGGLSMLTKSMAVEWGKKGILCNGIAPGFFATDMNEELVNDPEFDSWVRTRTPLDRWGSAEELIGAAVFLSSSASSFVNGHVLAVDGGFLASL